MDGTSPSPGWVLGGLILACACLAAGCGQASAPDDPRPGTAGQDATMREGEILVGTGGADVLRAGGGADTVRGLGGDDEISGGEGRDRLYGGPGDDVVDAQDPRSGGKAGRDEISCGPGRDEVLMDATDGERPVDCEMSGVGQS